MPQHTPPGRRRVSWTVDAELAEDLDALARRTGLSKSDLADAALRQLLQAPPAPPELPEVPAAVAVDLSASARRVWAALTEAWSAGLPTTSVALAERLELHRGNVDRHLAALRASGVVVRRGHSHVPPHALEAPLAS